MEQGHNMFELIFSYIVLVIALLGMVINACAFFVLQNREAKTHFHRMLQFLSIYDILVCLGGGLTYGLPRVWPFYEQVVFPFIAPTLAALVHIFLLTSVYTTVIISFERYIRICYLCQLRSFDLFAEEKSLRHVFFSLIIVPILFYIPKFFEYQLKPIKLYYDKRIDCPQVFAEAMNIEWTLDKLNYTHDLQDCFKHGFDAGVIFARRFQVSHEYKATAMRSEKLYYQLYCVGLNMLVASWIPLVALIFLNIRTVKALRKMASQHQQEAVHIELKEQHKNIVEDHVEEQSCALLEEDNNKEACDELDVEIQSEPSNEDEQIKAQERRLARISITIVWLFVMCHVWKLIPTIYESSQSSDGLDVPQWPFGLIVVESISHSLIIFNSAVNFLIYVLL